MTFHNLPNPETMVDVFMDYLAVVMLMVAIFAGTMQLNKDQVVCLPVLPAPVNSKAHATPGNADITTNVPKTESATDQDQDGRMTNDFLWRICCDT